MSILQRAIKNIFYKTIGEILSRLIYLAFFVYMARKIGANDFGLFSFAFSFAGIFAILIDPGLNILVTRDVAIDKSLTKKYYGNIFVVKSILSLITFFIIWSSLKLLRYDEYTINVVMLMGIFLILNAFYDYFIAVTDSHERMDISAVIKIANKLFISVFGSLALFFGGKLIDLLNWMILGSGMTVLLVSYLIRKNITNMDVKIDWRFLKKVMHVAFPIALTMVFTTLYFKIDIIMLSMFNVSNSGIGFYSAAVKLIEILNVIPAVFVSGIFPILASFSEKIKSELESTFKKSFQTLLLIAAPIVVTTAILSDNIIRVIYGSAYINSAIALRILIWTSLFIFPNFLLSNLIVIANRQKLNALFSFSCLVLNVILNLFLIPHYSFVGASIATVVTDMVFFTLTTAFACRYFNDLKFLKEGIKPLVCGALLAIILLSLSSLYLIIVLPIAIASYMMLIFATKTFTMEDIQQIKKIFAISKNR